MQWLAVFFLLLSQASFAGREQEIKKLHLIQDCNILDFEGNMLRVLPGLMCLFLEDGSYISAGPKWMKRLDKKNHVMWEIKGHFHHQLAFSNDRKRILALASDVTTTEGRKIRSDKFMIINLDGEVIHQLTSDVLLGWSGQKVLDWIQTPWLQQEVSLEREASHFNSFYEIPEIKTKSKDLPFKKGDFVLNGLTHGIYFVSSDLKQLKKHIELPMSQEHYVHDVQVMKSGEIIYFNNLTLPATELDLYSSIQQYDLSSKKVTFQFTSNPKSMFYTRNCGSVQELDDDYILFSDRFNGTYVYSRNKKQLLYTVRATHYRNRVPILHQNTKAQDLSMFLNLHTGR